MYTFIFMIFITVSGDLFSESIKSSQSNFSMIEQERQEAFETEIAYFFGVADTRPVVQAYIGALRRLETLGHNCSSAVYEQEIIPFLEMAYRSIAEQRNWYFNTHAAAQIELQIILSNLTGTSFDTVKNLMVQLYTLVFQCYCPQIEKAAMLRTFLYQYKTEVLKKERRLSWQDQKLIVEIANLSKNYLNSIK